MTDAIHKFSLILAIIGIQIWLGCIVDRMERMTIAIEACEK